MDCSGTPHVVDHCSPRWSAVVPLYFHCPLTANISSAVDNISNNDNGIATYFIDEITHDDTYHYDNFMYER